MTSCLCICRQEVRGNAVKFMQTVSFHGRGIITHVQYISSLRKVVCVVKDMLSGSYSLVELLYNEQERRIKEKQTIPM
jgi:hypothetical protein